MKTPPARRWAGGKGAAAIAFRACVEAERAIILMRFFIL